LDIFQRNLDSSLLEWKHVICYFIRCIGSEQDNWIRDLDSKSFIVFIMLIIMIGKIESKDVHGVDQ
jgi:hypothetical protein